MIKYQSKPITIEAYQFEGTFESKEEVKTILGEYFRGFLYNSATPPKLLGIEFVIEGKNQIVHIGEWLIKDISGRFTTCGCELFTQNYVKVEQTN